MRKMCRLFLMIALVILAGAGAFAQTRDNFAGGGMELYGGASGYFDKSYVLDPNALAFSANVSISPGFEVFVTDGLGFFLEPTFSFTRRYTDALNESNSASYGGTLGIDYYIVVGDSPIFVPSVGLSGGVFLLPGSWGARNGVSFSDKPLTIRWEIDLPVSLNFFVTDHIALYLRAYPTLRYSYLLTNIQGEPFTDTTPFMDRVGIYVNVQAGVRFFSPVRDRMFVKF